MVELYLKGRVENVLRGRDYKNNETGEVRRGAVKLQFLAMDEVRGLSTVDVSVPEELEPIAYDLKGKEVSLKVEAFARNSKIYYRLLELEE